MSASFASDAMLEGTMTLAQFDTAAAAMRVVRQVRRSQRERAFDHQCVLGPQFDSMKHSNCST